MSRIKYELLTKVLDELPELERDLNEKEEFLQNEKLRVLELEKRKLSEAESELELLQIEQAAAPKKIQIINEDLRVIEGEIKSLNRELDSIISRFDGLLPLEHRQLHVNAAISKELRVSIMIGNEIEFPLIQIAVGTILALILAISTFWFGWSDNDILMDWCFSSCLFVLFYPVIMIVVFNVLKGIKDIIVQRIEKKELDYILEHNSEFYVAKRISCQKNIEKYYSESSKLKNKIKYYETLPMEIQKTEKSLIGINTSMGNLIEENQHLEIEISNIKILIEDKWDSIREMIPFSEHLNFEWQ